MLLNCWWIWYGWGLHSKCCWESHSRLTWHHAWTYLLLHLCHWILRLTRDHYTSRCHHSLLHHSNSLLLGQPSSCSHLCHLERILRRDSMHPGHLRSKNCWILNHHGLLWDIRCWDFSLCHLVDEIVDNIFRISWIGHHLLNQTLSNHWILLGHFLDYRISY